ncbi:MAG: hypothetical protein ACRCTJ_02760, partial [Brevinema sp.]
KRSEDLSDEDIQRAVQQTLMNLEVLPIYRTNKEDSSTNTNHSPLTEEEAANLKTVELTPFLSSDTNNISASNTSTPPSDLVSFDFSQISTPKLGLSGVEHDVAQFLGQTKQELFLIRSRTLDKQLRAEQEFLTNEGLVHRKFLKQMSDLSNKITLYRRMEDKLLLAYKTPLNLLKERVSEYYKHRDEINLEHFQIKSQINAENHKRKSREGTLREKLDYIKSLEKEELDIFLKNKIFNYQIKINFYKERFDNAKTQKVAANLTSRFHTINPNNITPTNLADFRSDSSKSSSPSETLVEEMAYRQINDFSWTNNIFAQLPTMIRSEERIQNMQKYYQNVSVEKVPTLEDLPKETWLSDKEIWKKNNREIWLEQNNIWRQQIMQILGEDKYYTFKNKWLRPSANVAIKEASRAFNDGRYDEALFLHSFIPNDNVSILLLGRSYYELEAYQYAFSVFIVAYKMGIPQSKQWVDLAAEKLIGRKIVQN